MIKDKQFGVLGLGHFGESLAITLSNEGADVIVVDKSEEKIQNIANKVTYAVQADVADINALRSIGLKNVDVAVVSITSDINSNLMGVLNCQELGIPKVYSKANNIQHQKVLNKLGVEDVFNPENDMGIRAANMLLENSPIHKLDLGPESEYSIAEINPLKNWINKTLIQLDLRARFGINVIALVQGTEINISPGAADVIHKEDKLIVLAEAKVIQKIKNMSERGR